MDLTPLLPQVRDDVARAYELLRGVRLVLCLGSRAQITLLLTAPARILAASTSAAVGLAQVGRHRPGLLLVSDRLEEGCGVDLVLAVKRRFPRIRTLLLVSRAHPPGRLQEALQAGCEAIVPESRLLQGPGLQALHAVLGGGHYLDHSLLLALRPPEGSGAMLTEPLSRRERQVLARVVQGLTNQEIAAELRLSADTVKCHLRSVLVKLRARRRIQAVVIGLRLGLVDWPEAGGSR